MTERSLLLKGRKICATGLSLFEIDCTKKLIESLGGIFLEGLFKDTFCVLVKKFGSRKCIVAKNLNIPLVRFEWLKDCATNQILEPIDSYLAKPFTGLKFCLSGFSSAEFYITEADRQMDQLVLTTVVSLGGEVYNDLIEDIFCVLLKRVGSSAYQSALQQNIPCVNLQWVLDCQTFQSLLPLDDYLVKPLTGLSLSFTGFNFSPEQHNDVRALVSSLGGTNCEKLTLIDGTDDISSCTHLIAMEIKETEKPNPKLEAARRWKAINIVTRGWLDACAREGRWIHEIPFLHKANKKKSIVAEQAAKAKILKRLVSYTLLLTIYLHLSIEFLLIIICYISY